MLEQKQTIKNPYCKELNLLIVQAKNNGRVSAVNSMLDGSTYPG
jgi:hypothetical protein